MTSAPAQPAPANPPAIPGISVGDLAQDACLPYLGAADAKLLELYISPEIGFDLHALAARCRLNILNLVSWAHSQTIAPWIAAWNTIARQHRLHRNIDRRERAILALSGVLDVIKDPIELRRAASALIRAIDGPRATPSQREGAGGRVAHRGLGDPFNTSARRSGPSLREGLRGGFAGTNLQPNPPSDSAQTPSDSALTTQHSELPPEPDPADLPARAHLALADALNTVLSIREQEMRQRALAALAATAPRKPQSNSAPPTPAAPTSAPSEQRHLAHLGPQSEQLSPRRGDPDVSIGRGVSAPPIPPSSPQRPVSLPNPLCASSVFPPRPLRTAFSKRKSPEHLLAAAGVGPGP